MQKRSSKNRDANKTVTGSTEEATAQSEQEQKSTKNPAAVALGRLGGIKGGPARAKKLTAEQRREIAVKAAKIRWASEKQKDT